MRSPRRSRCPITAPGVGRARRPRPAAPRRPARRRRAAAPPIAPSPAMTDRVRVGPHRRGHPGGERGGGELVVGEQHQRGPSASSRAGIGGAVAVSLAQSRAGDRRRRRGRCPGRQSTMPAIRPRPIVDHRGRVEVVPQRVGAASVGTITWSRSSGSTSAGRPDCAARPAATAAGARRPPGVAAPRGQRRRSTAVGHRPRRTRATGQLQRVAARGRTAGRRRAR